MLMGSFKIQAIEPANEKGFTMTAKNFVLVLSLAIGSLATSWSHAHAKVETAEPKADSELSEAPKEIRLHFSDTLEPAFTKIVLLDAKNVSIKLPRAVVDKSNAKTVSAQLPVLGAGQYLVRWSTMSRDSHKVKGEYRFIVK
jgi:methionine-rich copper-binding protein CopC